MQLVRITLLLLPFLVTVPYTSSSLITQIGNSRHPFTSRYPQIPDPHTLSTTRRINTNSASTNAPSLPQRSIWLTDLGKGWVQYLETFDSLIPVQVAAAVLTNFYVSVVNHVLSIKTGQTPQSHFASELNNLRLEFISADHPVPWDSVLTFLTSMVVCVSKGFTGKFDYLFVHMATGRAVRVSLEVINLAAAARRL